MNNSSERKMLSALASHASWAATPDRAARTANARAALKAKFLDQAFGDVDRAESLRNEHYTRLSWIAAVANRKAREARARAADSETIAAAAEAELRSLGGIE